MLFFYMRSNPIKNYLLFFKMKCISHVIEPFHLTPPSNYTDKNLSSYK